MANPTTMPRTIPNTGAPITGTACPSGIAARATSAAMLSPGAIARSRVAACARRRTLRTGSVRSASVLKVMPTTLRQVRAAR